MTILHIITGLSIGGAERALYNLLQGGLADTFDCQVISLVDEGTMGKRIKSLGVPVTALGIRKGISAIIVLSKLRRVVKDIQPDLIQGWMYHGNLAAWLAKKLSEKDPVLVWNVRQSLYNLGDEKLLTRQVIRANRLLSSKPSVLLYNSQVSKKQHQAFGFSMNNGQVIPNGIDVEGYQFSEQARSQKRVELAISDDAPVVGHIARLHPVKDHSLFIGAALRLATRWPSLHFILIGRGVSYSSTELESLIPENLRNRFHLLGERSDISALLSCMDVFSSSSCAEGFPNVLGEAMASGLPCVATDVGDSAVIVSSFGVIVPPRDETELVDGIERLLMKSVNERRKLGERARKHIIDSFALESIVDKYSSLYQNAIKQKRTL